MLVRLAFFFIALQLLSSNSLFSQAIATFKVNAGNCHRINTPVSVNITQLTHLPDSVLILMEVTGGKKVTVPVQLENGRERLLWWILEGETKPGSVREYQLLTGQPKNADSPVKVIRNQESLVLKVDNRSVLQYNFKTVNPPAGVSPFFKRSGFIHPLWSPRGAILTNIQPKDHYHHYGIWNPWTKTHFEGKEIDFWNLYRKQGTVRFSDFISIVEGPIYGGFRALQNHVVYPDSVAEKIAMKEVWDIRVFNLSSQAYLWEFTSTLNMAGESPIVLDEYRYGGFGMRATAEWTNKNSRALTSEGKNRKNADGSLARWAWINGETHKGIAGVLFMSFPANFNHPEPIRMWPEDANGGRGDVFFNFSPTKNKSWHLTSGNEYTLKYRMLVFEGEISSETCEMLWTDFAQPPSIVISKK